LVSWLGKTDLRAPQEHADIGGGPIAQAVDSRDFDTVLILSDYEQSISAPYIKWLTGRTKTNIEVIREKLSGPTQFGEIYQAAVRGIQQALGDSSSRTELTLHLSPGTPAMAAVWILLGKTRFPAEFIESSRDHGVRTVAIPFDIAADFIPDLLKEQDERIREKSAALPPDRPEFRDIIHRSPAMNRLLQKAGRVAIRSVPVLIEGESGTGKEMLARAIHGAGPRRDQRFLAVNCGAIPAELVESELFGYEKGAFSDAKQARAGYFESANAGTLFLDEIGELPLPAQVKILRSLQEREVVRLGSTKPIKLDVRIIAATNRTLTAEIETKRFREDLFYRLAVAVLKIPPLRDRAGDLNLLIDHTLASINQELDSETTFKHKKLSAGARNLLLNHPWPGNVRELVNTLQRAVLWSDGQAISPDDVKESLLPIMNGGGNEALGRPLGENLKLPDLMKEIARHYLTRAMAEAHGNKTKAAELVGLPSYQTLTNWLDKYDVEV
jgi:transcriptional regulator with PAS, ATPase and Fis domain